MRASLGVEYEIANGLAAPTPSAGSARSSARTTTWASPRRRMRAAARLGRMRGNTGPPGGLPGADDGRDAATGLGHDPLDRQGTLAVDPTLIKAVGLLRARGGGLGAGERGAPRLVGALEGKPR